MVRGKFRCTSVAFYGEISSTSTRQYTFSAIYDTSTPENQRFTVATPWGEFKMNVTNPEVTFQVNREYYLDLTPVVVPAELPSEEPETA